MARKSKSMEQEQEQNDKPFKSKLIAQKDFVIAHNDYYKAIKKGDDLSSVPEKFLVNLRTEKVLL